MTMHFKAPVTIRDLFDQLPINQPYGEGSVARVYRLPTLNIGLDRYLTRVEHSSRTDFEDRQASFKRWLTHSTALVSVPVLATPFVAPPLMQINDQETITLHRYQPGVSLTKLRDRFLLRYQDDGYLAKDLPLLAARDVMDLLIDHAEQTGTNPFLSLCNIAYNHGYAGYSTDFVLANILWDAKAKTLRLVDQVETYLPLDNGRALAAQKELAHATMFLTSQFAIDYTNQQKLHFDAYDRRFETVSRLITQAKQEVLSHYRAHPKCKEQRTFAHVHHTFAVSLSDPPKQLLHALREIEQRSR